MDSTLSLAITSVLLQGVCLNFILSVCLLVPQSICVKFVLDRFLEVKLSLNLSFLSTCHGVDFTLPGGVEGVREELAPYVLLPIVH